MTRDTFEKLVEEGFLRLPGWVREKIKNVALLVEDEPSQEVREREHLEPDETLLGYYQGTPLSERGEMYGVGVTLPDTITIYIKPTLEMAEDEGKEVAHIVADTIWHEFAHHFGMNENEVRGREKERDEAIGVCSSR